MEEARGVSLEPTELQFTEGEENGFGGADHFPNASVSFLGELRLQFQAHARSLIEDAIEDC